MQETPDLFTVSWNAVDKALKRAASQYVSHLQGPQLSEPIVIWPKLPVEFRDAVFSFKSENGTQCYPDIPCQKLLQGLEGTVNNRQLLQDCLSNYQHQLKPAESGMRGSSRVVRDPITGKATISISHNVKLCQGAICQLNDLQISGLVKYMAEKLTVGFDDCTTMQDTGCIPSQLAHEIQQIQAAYLESSNLTCADIGCNPMDSTRMTLVNIQGLQELSQPPKIYPQKSERGYLSNNDYGSIAFCDLNLFAKADPQDETVRYSAFPRVASANMLRGLADEFNLVEDYFTCCQNSLKKHMPSLSAEDLEHIHKYGRLPDLLEGQLKLAVEQDFAGFKLADVMTKHQAHAEQAMELIIPITMPNSVPQSSPSQLIMEDTSTPYDKKCQDLLKSLANKITCRLHSLPSISAKHLMWANVISEVRQDVISAARIDLSDRTKIHPDEHEADFSTTVEFVFFLLDVATRDLQETTAKQANLMEARVSIKYSRGNGETSEVQLDPSQVPIPVD